MGIMEKEKAGLAMESQMNEQEMQFADPDWKPVGPLPAPQENETTSTPLPGPVNGYSMYDAGQNIGASPYEQGYQGYRGFQRGQSFSTPPLVQQQIPGQQAGRTRRRGSSWWIWLIVILFLLPMIGGISRSFNRGFTYSSPPFQQPQSQIQVSGYDLNGVSQLAITDTSGGSVLVQVSSENTDQVTVQTDRDAQPSVDRGSNSLNIDTDDGGNVIVTIPQDMALSLSITAGSLEVDDFSGQLTAQANSGTIDLENDILSDQSSLTSKSGNITLRNVILNGQVTVKTGEDGEIDFSGSLAPQGKYQFTTESGDITLNLPDSTSMRVQPSPGDGSYQSDFPNSTGKGPKADVSVTTDSGTISIHNGFDQ